MSGILTIGASDPILIPYSDVRDRSLAQNADAIRQGPEGQRGDQIGLVKARYATLHKGLTREGSWLRVHGWSSHLDRYAKSEGLQTHIPFGLYLPYLLTDVDTFLAADIAGFNAANLRINCCEWPSSTGGRWMAGWGTTLFRDTSVTVSTLEAPTLSGAAGVNVHAAAIAQVTGGNVSLNDPCLLLGYRRTAINSPAIYATADPTAATVVFVAQDATTAGAGNGRVFGLCWLPTLGLLFTYGVVYGTTAAAFVSGFMVGATISLQTAGQYDPTLLTLTGFTQAHVKMGGHLIGEAPWRANRVGVFTPVGDDDETGVTRPRRFGFVDVASSTTATYVAVNTDMADSRNGCYWLGGTVIIGEPDSTTHLLCRRAVFIDSSGNGRNLNFPPANGDKPWGLLWVRAEGLFLVGEAVYLDQSDSVFVYLFDGSWHVSTPLQSKAQALTLAPIAQTQPLIASGNRRAYRIYPDATVVNYSRIFVPVNLLDDPQIVNTSEAKHYGSLSLTTVEVDMGPEENDKALMQQVMQSRRVSGVAGSYGTVRVYTGTAGADGAISAGDNVFDSYFELYEPTPIGFRTLVHKIELTNGSTNEGNAEAATANALPFMDVFVSIYPHMKNLDFIIGPDALALNDGWEKLNARLRAKFSQGQGGAAAQLLSWGQESIYATWRGWDVDLLGVELGEPQRELVTDARGNPKLGALGFRQARPPL